jgi:IS1 family transposase
MPARCTRSWSLFPPQTREVQFDEKWAFVGKKDKHCASEDPADAKRGDSWDHVALDAEHRLVVSVVPGKRTAENVEKLVDDFKARTGGRPMQLITSDEYRAYKPAILNAYGQEVVPPRTGKPGRPKAPYKVAPPELQYATVHKTRAKGRVVNVDFRVIFGTVVGVMAALALSQVSKAINIAFVERHHGTDRHRNARKSRRSYGFSKNWEVHEAITYFTIYSYNFCWLVRTLRVKGTNGHWQQRTPAMAAGLADHIWTLSEWLTFPGAQRK